MKAQILLFLHQQQPWRLYQTRPWGELSTERHSAGSLCTNIMPETYDLRLRLTLGRS